MINGNLPRLLADSCGQIRRADSGDVISGVQPTFVATPASAAEASAVMRAAATLDLAVVPRGTGTKLSWGYPPERCDVVLETLALDRVVEHAAGDLVVTVQAGVPLERLADVLGAAGQRLALDPPPLNPPDAGAGAAGTGAAGTGAATRGTVGGVLASGAAGPLRLRYGAPRDLLLGVTVVLADGTIARSGGKVVKNVAGYDLGKLFAGSRGTLGLITEATFRLHPVPAATAYLTVTCASAADACQIVTAALDSEYAPVSAEIDWPSGAEPVQVSIALEGDPAALTGRAAALAGRLAEAGTAAAGPGGAAPEPDPPAWWGAAPAAATLLQLAFWPGDLTVVLAGIRSAAAAAGLDPGVRGSACAGVLLAALPAAPATDVAAFITSLRAAIGHREPGRDSGQARASAVVLHAPPELSGLVDMFGPVPSLALMRSVKARFDPGRQLAPGRFAGRI